MKFSRKKNIRKVLFDHRGQHKVSLLNLAPAITFAAFRETML